MVDDTSTEDRFKTIEDKISSIASDVSKEVLTGVKQYVDAVVPKVAELPKPDTSKSDPYVTLDELLKGYEKGEVDEGKVSVDDLKKTIKDAVKEERIVEKLESERLNAEASRQKVIKNLIERFPDLKKGEGSELAKAAEELAMERGIPADLGGNVYAIEEAAKMLGIKPIEEKERIIRRIPRGDMTEIPGGMGEEVKITTEDRQYMRVFGIQGDKADEKYLNHKKISRQMSEDKAKEAAFGRGGVR